jgi:hypothetical protein
MDHATRFSMRLKEYASTLVAANARSVDDRSVEEWLGFWDEDESVFGNVRNLEHWLSEAARQNSARRTRPDDSGYKARPKASLKRAAKSVMLNV